MNNKQDCRVSECCRTHGCKILGIVFFVLATLLTLYTLNGLGILGMFIAGLACCHHHHKNMGCKTCGCCSTSCDTSTNTNECVGGHEENTTHKN